jgi:hypothetical protein
LWRITRVECGILYSAWSWLFRITWSEWGILFTMIPIVADDRVKFGILTSMILILADLLRRIWNPFQNDPVTALADLYQENVESYPGWSCLW